jgi:MFS family permease
VDGVGVGLLGVGVLLLLLPLVQAQTWTGAARWLLVPAGLAVLAGFVVWERRFAGRGGDPMVDLDLFRRGSYSLGASLGLLYFAGFTAIFFVLGIYLQSGLGYTAWEAGLAITPFAFGSALASGVSGRFVTRLGRPLVATGLLVVVLGLVVTAVVVDRRREAGIALGWAVAVPLLVAGLGSGVVISPNITLTLSQVPVGTAGTAGGMLQTGQRIGAAVGIAAVGSVFFDRLATSRGDWTQAAAVALWLCAGIVALSAVLAVLDLRLHGSRRPQGGDM